MIEITIDGKKIEVEKETKILEAANRLGINIPTLCYHEGLPPDGNCRLCQVEVVKGGKSKLAIACMFPVREPMEVFTDNENVMEARRSIIKLHLNRCPQAKILQDLAEEYGVEPLDERFVAENPDLCIRCGRCVRACEALGNNCIGFSGRGWNREIVPPFNEPPEGCLGCAACAEVCPTGAIVVREDNDTREIWGRTFKLVRCKSCGDPIGTEEYIEKRGKEEIEGMDLCPRCKKRDEAERVGNI
ncbi:2Fe-2S iron-sulfur cluster binding domain-containing protein [Methanoplanus sp. FWC-SCC4]|uniref:2Fe-2S iron-sulfur cluster binding domain-containing protein n=1 Tax=Methanochimaera problematica TaxID=2609417 RepID=A0AA97FDT0_9EURY|nr:2Fe-2S iron-sulfur cluster-binding protein [Methanoplanus sp. FWC-SCC4]WOF16428.1 2Fe-2S iron-sulfur cluster binding domain-containing protein [Methanoplanus sp. FWC-SCC4]